MREIAPDIICWSAFHPGIRETVFSYALVESGILLDPMLPPDGGLEALASVEPKQIVLTNRHHHRDAAAIASHFGIAVRVSKPGVDDASKHVPVTAFEWNEQLAPGVTALEVGAICPDESAIHINGESTALACADGVIRIAGELCFVPDFLLGDDAEQVKAGLRDAYRRLLELAFDHLLLAHGEPVIGRGHEALAAFAGAANRF
ncbi:MAG: hypothetical protein JJE27_01785 [Thermoleophilia bacterium]|nr:hypothetical protein [Thermoleophilia bacterium]